MVSYHVEDMRRLYDPGCLANISGKVSLRVPLP